VTSVVETHGESSAPLGEVVWLDERLLAPPWKGAQDGGLSSLLTLPWLLEIARTANETRIG
jgi:hypothetical protein